MALEKLVEDFATSSTSFSRGVEIIFQPPYHPEVQATEEIWGAAKNKVAHRRSHEFSKASVEQLFSVAMGRNSNGKFVGKGC